jgi:hypothetical protein
MPQTLSTSIRPYPNPTQRRRFEDVETKWRCPGHRLHRRFRPVIGFDSFLIFSPRKRRGWEPEALLNWLALAGWGAQHEETPLPTPSMHASRSRLVQGAPDSTTVMGFSELVDKVCCFCHGSAVTISHPYSSNSRHSRNAVQVSTLLN